LKIPIALQSLKRTCQLVPDYPKKLFPDQRNKYILLLASLQHMPPVGAYVF